ncbi:PSS-domain-containing protein [Mycena galericulata]|nr:PSS-domain-containing protein [Mycena galericulata]
MRREPALVDPPETELSPTSPGEDSDAVLSSGVVEPEPIPGIDGTPADRTEPYTRITPFQERHDTSVEFFYKPVTLTTLTVLLIVLAYLAMTQDVLAEGADKRRMGAYAAIAAFLAFSMIQFRDGPFIRPHPAFWRAVLGVNLLYELALVFLLFQDLASARRFMLLLDPKLGVPLPEKGYADDCSLTPATLWNALDVFCVAHTLGWFGKALILRDYWFCWILSIAFELAEYSLQHQLPNFNECWWDHWILDVLVCNWIGTYLGMKTCQYLEVKPYEWRGLPPVEAGAATSSSQPTSPVVDRASPFTAISAPPAPPAPTPASVPAPVAAPAPPPSPPPPPRPSKRARLRSNAARALRQLGPHDFTAFKWGTASSFAHYVSVVLLLAVFLAAELGPFYLKSLLWMEPDHPIVILRLTRAVRMGQHVWLLLATVLTELLVILKWSKGLFPAPFPTAVKVGWALGLAVVGVYPVVKVRVVLPSFSLHTHPRCFLRFRFRFPCKPPTYTRTQFGIPSARRYARRQHAQRRKKAL